MTLRCFLSYVVKHRARVHQLDFIGAFLQATFNNMVFVKLDIRYADYFPEYSHYFGRALRLFKAMYGANNSGKLFYDKLTEWILEAGFIQYQCQMSIYYKYAPDGTQIVVLSYVGYCVYWYTSEDLGKWFVDALVKIFHVNFLGCAYWFMSIRISHMKDHSISVYQAKYATYIFEKYLDTATVKTGTKLYKTTLTSYMIFTKDDAYTSDEKVEKLTRELNIHYRACIGSLIHL